MHPAGGLNCKSVLSKTNIHMGPDSENIPSECHAEWCDGGGREARPANLKQKPRDIARSVAETFTYCTLNTVSIEDSADILQTFGKMSISCLLISECYFMYIACRLVQFPILHITIYIFDIYCIQWHILRYCSDAYASFRDCFCPEDVQYSSLPTFSKDVLRAMLPSVEINAISLHEGDGCTCDLACQILGFTTIHLSWEPSSCPLVFNTLRPSPLNHFQKWY